MLAGQLAGQLSLVVVIPLLTRRFSPAEMGPYQLATSVALILQPLATFSLELVIPIAATQRIFKQYCRAAALGIGGITLLFALIGTGFFFLGRVSVGEVLLMCALLIVSYGWTTVDNAILIRRGLHSRLALRNFLSGTIAAGLQLLGASLWGNVLSLALAILIARAIAIVITRPLHPALLPNELAGSKGAIYTPTRAAFTVASNVIGSGSMQVLTILGGSVLGSASAGYIGIAQRVAGTPISLLGLGLSQLVQSHTAPIIREQKPILTRGLLRSVVPLSFVAACAIAGLVIGAPLLAVPLLGPGWQTAGYATAILAVPMSLQLVVSPVMAVLVMLSRERLLFGLQASRFGASALACLIALDLHAGVLIICASFSAAMSLSYIVILITVLVETRKYDRRNISFSDPISLRAS
jgi:O-antigen/teichoic acid export membrane protein